MKQIYHCLIALGGVFGLLTNGYAQQAQGIRGKIVDVETYQPIAGVNIWVPEVDGASTTDEKGEFTIPISKKGPYKIVSKYLGYLTDTTSVNFDQPAWQDVHIVLVSEASNLDEVVVTRRRAQFTELALLEERREASLVVEKIGSEELSRKGVSDAAGAVSQLAGVSTQEGSTQVYVRGLGDRYNSTSLNGLPIPASDPNLKNIALDIFDTDVVEYIGVDKVYNASLNGDFGGANVDISSKKFRGDRFVEFAVGSAINTNALGQMGNFRLQQGPGFLGYSDFSLPADAQGSYHFQNSWDAEKKNVLPLNFGIRAGDSFAFGNQSRLSVFGTANFSNGYDYREGVNWNIGAQGDPQKRFQQTQFSYNTRTTGMFNAHLQQSQAHSFSYNFLYVNSSNQFSDNFAGYIRDAAELDNGLVRRQTFERTTLLVNQLMGKHRLTEKIDLDWALAYNLVDGDMPDRMQSMLRTTPEGDYRFIRVNAPDNHRYSSFLKEDEFVGNISARYKLGEEERGSLTVGYSGKKKKRSFDVMQLNFDIDSELRDNTVIDPNNLDAYLGSAGFGSFYQLRGFAGNAFQYYNGDQDNHAGYVSLDYAVTDKLTAVLGARFEYLKQYVDYYNVELKGSNTISKNAFLPSLNLRYALHEKHNLRFGASKTYTMPQFKERARFPYEDVTQEYIGNPYLTPSDNYNVDLKWEMFPSASELVAVGVFGKYIENPINEIVASSSVNAISYANTGEMGYVYGAEVELKKDLMKWDNGDKLSLGFNMALMKTHQEFDEEKVWRETQGVINIDPTHQTSKFTGASDYIINGDISYRKNFQNDKNLTATVLYNYYSDKLFAIGTGQMGNKVDRGLSTLDFVLKSKLSRNIELDLTARNLLNPEFERWQENVVPVKVLSYKRGAYFSLGVKYRL